MKLVWQRRCAKAAGNPLRLVFDHFAGRAVRFHQRRGGCRKPGSLRVSKAEQLEEYFVDAKAKRRSTRRRCSSRFERCRVTSQVAIVVFVIAFSSLAEGILQLNFTCVFSLRCCLAALPVAFKLCCFVAWFAGKLRKL